MNFYTVEMYSPVTGACLGVLTINPADYLEYDTAEEAEEAIIASFNSSDIIPSDDDEPSSVENDVEIDIPDTFWEEWEILKSN